MPELPDITIYVEALERRILGETLIGIRIASPFLLRTVDPSPAVLAGLKVSSLGRIGKRIVIGFGERYFLAVHLMIAGRLHWKQPGAKIPARTGLAAFDFASGSLLLTEAGSKRRASLHLFDGAESLRTVDPGGRDVFTIGLEDFASALRSENHTLKRSLTDPRLFSGIGNAYSDEILHRARLSPVLLTSRISDAEIARLHRAVREVLEEWVVRLRAKAGDQFPEKVTAFHDEMAVHGRFGKPCPDCGSPVQRIVYASNETNYCARCQTDGRVLADRALSRLLGKDWPRSLDEL